MTRNKKSEQQEGKSKEIDVRATKTTLLHCEKGRTQLENIGHERAAVALLLNRKS